MRTLQTLLPDYCPHGRTSACVAGAWRRTEQYAGGSSNYYDSLWLFLHPGTSISSRKPYLVFQTYYRIMVSLLGKRCPQGVSFFYSLLFLVPLNIYIYIYFFIMYFRRQASAKRGPLGLLVFFSTETTLSLFNTQFNVITQPLSQTEQPWPMKTGTR